MYSLISGAIESCRVKREVQLLILGVDYAGKTTILEQSKGIFRKQKGISVCICLYLCIYVCMHVYIYICI